MDKKNPTNQFRERSMQIETAIMEARLEDSQQVPSTDEEEEEEDNDDSDEDEAEDRASQFLHQLEEQFKRYNDKQAQYTESIKTSTRISNDAGSIHEPEWLDLTFSGCEIQLMDVRELKHCLDRFFHNATQNEQQNCAPWRLRLSFPGCRLGCQDTLMTMEDLFQQFAVDALDFTWAEFHVYELQRLIMAATLLVQHRRTICPVMEDGLISTPGSTGLQRLELSLRYQHGTIAPLLETCTTSTSTDDSSPPHGLSHLKLSTRYPLEHRVRLVCVQELVMALLPFQSIPLSMLPLSTAQQVSSMTNRPSPLTIFELTHCELDDEIFALLMGGLLALKGTLKMIHLHMEGGYHGSGRGLTWQSLPLLGHLLTEFPHLTRLKLHISDCRQLLKQGNNTFSDLSDAQNNQTGRPGIMVDTIHDASANAIRTFAKALQQRPPDTSTNVVPHNVSIQLNWSNVGWTKDVALQLFEAASHNEIASDISLIWSDSDFLVPSAKAMPHDPDDHDEQFVYHLATYLRDMKHVTELQLIDTGPENDAAKPLDQDYEHSCWWNDDVNRGLLVDACEKNPVLENLELRAGHHRFKVATRCDNRKDTSATLGELDWQEQAHAQQPIILSKKVKTRDDQRRLHPF